MGVAGTAPVQTLSLPRLIIRPEALASISKTMRPGVADTNSFCLRGMPAARRSSRESTIRLEASSVTVVFMPLVWLGHGVFARAGNDVSRVTYKWRELAESELGIGIPKTDKNGWNGPLTSIITLLKRSVNDKERLRRRVP